MDDNLSPQQPETPSAKTSDAEADSLKKTKKRKKKAAFSKGVETMYRNAYRAQLDLISLAATKANIMISLNGLIVSILLVSGSVLFEKSPEFIIPMVIFLLTSVSSIYFALSSASPEAPVKRKKLLPCLFELLKGNVHLKDFNSFRNLPQKHFDRKNSNILIFEDYAKISRDVYLECMDELINDPQKLYSRMSDQLYYLGKTADKKFTLLRYSYSVFRWGLILAITVFISLKIIHFLFPHTSEAATDLVASSEFMNFDKIYEPSGVQSLPDGRLIIIEDEASSALHVMQTRDDTSLKEDFRLSSKLRNSFNKTLNDLEAITLGPDGYLYAMTSHQRNLSGDRRGSRELFIRFKMEGSRIIDAGVYEHLVDVIDESGILGEVDEQGNGGIYNINIEALSFNKEGQLMIGFRAPLNGDKTIIGIMQNPADVFEHNAKPVISEKPLLLDLHGGGIRAMSYDSVLGGYLISNEVFGIGENNNRKFSQLLFWDGNSSHRVHHINKPGIKNIEGITSLQVEGERRILVVSDDGKKLKNLPAKYMLLEYADLTDK